MEKNMQSKNQYGYPVLSLVINDGKATLFHGSTAPWMGVEYRKTTKKQIREKFAELQALGFECKEV